MIQLREYKILLERLPAGKTVDPNKNGERSKFGGKPDWIQYDEVPVCTSCKTEMVFIAQLDSIEHQSDTNPHSIDPISPEQQYMFGDVGMFYVFFCFECGEPGIVFQSY